MSNTDELEPEADQRGRTVAQSSQPPVIRAALPELAPGQVIAERFRLEALVGRGGMGVVWKATHLALQAPVAIKLLFPAEIDPEQARARFLREARASAALRSSNIVQVFDYGVHEGMPYLVMELLEGESLDERLAAAGALSLDATLEILADVCNAVARAHELDVIHRDLKPANIFLVRDAEREHAKVLDFGIAKFLGKSGGPAPGFELAETQTGAVLGTPFYMSPEQLLESKSVDHRTDLWSLGVITFECLTGRRPFESQSLAELCVSITTGEPPAPEQLAELPRGMDAWMRKALAREPAERFTSAGELLASLRAVAAGDGSKTRHEPEFELGDDLGPDLSLALPIERGGAEPARGPHVAAPTAAKIAVARPSPSPSRGRLSTLTILMALVVVAVLGYSAYLALSPAAKEAPIAGASADEAELAPAPEPASEVASDAYVPDPSGFGDPCSEAADCGWDDPCVPTRCVGAEHAGTQTCEAPGPAPGACLCVAGRCALRPDEPPPASEAASCEGSVCGLDQGAGRCIAGAMEAANERVEEGPVCVCDEATRRCSFHWVEPIPCRKTSQCWVSAAPPYYPVPRPRDKRSHSFSPCRDGPVAPTCRDGRCSLVAYGCD